jgi:hypothetical protein
MNAQNVELHAAPVNTQAPAGRAEAPRSYQKPALHELGSLGRLQAYGFNYFDGRRYKNDPCN